MSKNAFYIGVDVGQEELWAVIEGEKTRKFSNSMGGIRKMWGWAKKYALARNLHFAMEATGVYSYSLAVQLSKHPDTNISIINPAQIAFFARAQLRRTKTDGVDAQVILAFAQSQNPPCWSIEPKALRQLYHFVVQADRLRETQRQWSNRAHSYKYIPDLPKAVARTQKSLNRSIQRQLVRIEKEIEQLCRNDQQLDKQVKLLCSIPGIASHSAVRILAYGRRTLTDRSPKALTAHAGLAPAQKQSGISVNGKNRIAKQGDRRLRTALFMPALVAAFHNPILKKFYQRLVENGKPKMLAIVAVMKKLLIMIQAILIKEKTFNPDYLSLT